MLKTVVLLFTNPNCWTVECDPFIVKSK